MMNLFNQSAGFRLARLEIYNWGTFDKQIWTMTPNGQTAVLTGANGSGKSTVVDALLTLLIESGKRNYNLASGAASSRERSEKTYVRGQYSRTRGESAIESHPNTLRDNQSHSVLLGVFEDAAQDRIVTLAQVLWIATSERVDKRYYVANCDLTIEKHFPQRHISARDLPKGAQVFDSFKDYIAAARKSLGLGGRHKALELFNQTVAVKDIPSLNKFVRDHMLDKGNPEEKVDGLRTQYRELNNAYTAISRARHQLEILAPLVKASSEYRHYEDRINRYEMAKSVVPFYVADRAIHILNDAIQKAEILRNAEKSKLDIADNELSNHREALEQIRIAIAQDNVGQMKREIEGKLPLINREIQTLKRAAERYDESARSLGFMVYNTEDDFYQQRERAQLLLTENIASVKAFDVQRFDAHTILRKNIEEKERLNHEIEYLKANPSNIPSKVACIRQQIATALNLPMDKLPFAGELLQIRAGEYAWQGALERLLNSFAQELLISTEYYQEVRHYVNEHHLQGRLIYRHVNLSQNVGALPQHTPQKEGYAYDKVEIQQNTPYRDWLSMVLVQKFAYACCENVDQFQRVDKAITPQGQIKHTPSVMKKMTVEICQTEATTC